MSWAVSSNIYYNLSPDIESSFSTNVRLTETFFRAIYLINSLKMLPIILKTYQLTGYYSIFNHNKSNSLLLTMEVALITYIILQINATKS